jgi:hypothetical protein
VEKKVEHRLGDHVKRCNPKKVKADLKAEFSARAKAICMAIGNCSRKSLPKAPHVPLSVQKFKVKIAQKLRREAKKAVHKLK